MSKLKTLRSYFESPTSIDTIKDHIEYYRSAILDITNAIKPENNISEQELEDSQKEIESCNGIISANQYRLDVILEKLDDLQISVIDYEKYCILIECERDLHSFDGIRIGCTCGCGGDSYTYEFIDRYENNCKSTICEITKELNGD